MGEQEKNEIALLLVEAGNMLPEPQRQRILGIAEGVAIAVSGRTTQNNDK